MRDWEAYDFKSTFLEEVMKPAETFLNEELFTKGIYQIVPKCREDTLCTL